MSFLDTILSYLPSSFSSPLASLTSRGTKNILKQLIGHFLEDELDTHQVDLQLTSGLLKLNSLTLSAPALNHEILNAIVGEVDTTTATTTTIEPDVGSIPFRIERCSIDNFSVKFSSLSTILEEGCSVDVSGLVLDLTPGHTLAEEFIAIATDRRNKREAREAERRAKVASRYAQQATRAARRASAVAAGLPLTSSLHDEVHDDDDDKNDEEEEDDEEKDDDAKFDNATFDDEMARESATFLTKLLEQVFDNICVSGDNIRIRLRCVGTCDVGLLDSFIEIHFPHFSFRAEEEGTKRIIQFSSFSVAWISNRVHSDLLDEHDDLELDGIQTTLISLGESDETGLPNRVAVSGGSGMTNGDGSGGSGNGGDGGGETLIEIFCKRGRARIPKDPMVIARVLEVAELYLSTEGAEEQLAEMSGSVLDVFEEDVVFEDENKGEAMVEVEEEEKEEEKEEEESLLGRTMTASQVYALGVEMTPETKLETKLDAADVWRKVWSVDTYDEKQIIQAYTVAMLMAREDPFPII